MASPFLDAVVELGSRFHTPFLLLLAVVAQIAVRDTPRGGEAHSRKRFGQMLMLAHLALMLAASGVTALRSQTSHDLVIVTGLVGTLAFVVLGAVVVFEGIWRRLRPRTPRIVPDVITSAFALVALMRASSRLGVELSGIIATSAVLTAVIGLSLQDTLGNVLGGLALQLDQSINVGDWVKVNDVSGRVSEIRWRYTAIETRNWETVIIPNNVLTKQQVVVLGRRHDQPEQWRRWVKFQVDYRTAPSNVMEVVQGALRAQPIQNVAAQPPPNCIAYDFGDSAITYAVRYWLTDLAVDDPTDSSVRTVIFFALRRAGIPFSIPGQSVLLTHDDQQAQRQREEELARRRAALARIDLFRGLGDHERLELANNLHPAPFTRGEVLTRLGAEAHHLYTIVAGEVSVRVGEGNEEHEVSRLGPGSFFGEMALLTGEKRRATVVALSDVECYRLDADAFRSLLVARPDLAETVASVLAERKVGLSAANEKLDEAARASQLAHSRADMLARIRSFFALGGDGRPKQDA